MSLHHDLAGLLEGATEEQQYDVTKALRTQVYHWLRAIHEDVETSDSGHIEDLLVIRNAVHDLCLQLRGTPNSGGEQLMEMDKVITDILKVREP